MMRPRHIVLLLLAAVVAIAALAGPVAASGRDVIRDCSEDGQIDGNYSRAELEAAENDLDGVDAEYNDCREAIRQARDEVRGPRAGIAGVDGPRGGSLGGGAGAPDRGGRATEAADTPDEVAALREPTAGGKEPPPVSIGGQRVSPGGGGILGVAESTTDLPAPLLIALVALVALALAGGYMALDRRRPLRGRVSSLLRRR